MYELTFLWGLFCTVTIETIAGLLLKKFAPKYFELTKVEYWRLAILIILASCLTLPYVWFIFPAFIQNRIAYIAVVETFAFVMEGIWYFLSLKINLKKALLFSLIINAISFLIGLLIFR